jgi:hypothetical protein
MEQVLETIIFILGGVALGLGVGYGLGKLRGIAIGRDKTIAKVKTLVIRGKLDFDISSLLRGDPLKWNLHTRGSTASGSPDIQNKSTTRSA